MKTRPIAADDLERVAQLLKEDEEHLLGRPSQVGANDLRDWLSRADLANDTVVYEENGDVAAVGWVDFPEESDKTIALGIVHPRYKGRGIGTEILALNEERARGRAKRVHAITIGGDGAAQELLAAHGYREIRRFYDMAIDQTEPPPPVDLPVEPVTEADLRDVHAALEDAWRDHWESSPTTFDEWWARHSENPNLDLSTWFMIRAGGEVAAATRNEPNRNGGGYIAALGVRRAHRGKGYAKALLLHSFRVFFERGMPRVTLGVDAESPTGATHLYEKVGMHVELENIVFEKRIAE
jgi:ribosomal protein S18 acetylase RimI-like enzyme